MRQVTLQLIHDFRILELGYDFMGYPPQSPPLTPQPDLLTYHHLLVPSRISPSYTYENGVILYSTPHAYLHVIESISPPHFQALTREMYNMKRIHEISPNLLENIDLILQDFEAVHHKTLTRKCTPLIRPQYLNRVTLTPASTSSPTTSTSP